MRALQYLTLLLFGVCAVLTAFFQIRTGMKDGEVERKGSEHAATDREKYSRLARLCAILAAVFLVICMIFGALSR